MRTLILILIIMPTIVFARDCEDHEARHITDMDGKTTILIVPRSKVVNGPQWSPKSSNVPLSMNGAYELVKSWASTNLTRYDSIEVQSIKAERYGCWFGSSNKDYWYYVIEYSPVIDGNKLYGSGNLLAVLMSGEVVPAVRK